MIDEQFKELDFTLANIILATIIVIFMTILNTFMISSYSSNILLTKPELFSAPILTETFQENSKIIVKDDDINLIKEIDEYKPTINELERIKYRITVINNRQQDLDNIVVTDFIPENTVYTENVQLGDNENYIVDIYKKVLEWNIEHLATYETYTIEYEVLVSPLYDKEELEIGTKASLLAENIDKPLESNVTTVKILKTDYKLDYKSSKNEHDVLKENSRISYYGMITNISGEVKDNSDIFVQLPEEVEYINIDVEKINTINGNNVEKNINIEYNKNNNIVIIKNANLQANEAISFTLNVKISKVKDNNTIKSYFWVENQLSKETTNTIEKTKLLATMESEFYIENSTSYIVYTIVVENLGNTIENNVLITDIIPNMLMVKECTINNVKIESNDIVRINTVIKPNERTIIKIRAIKKANYNNDIVINDALVKTETGEDIRTNKIILNTQENSELSKISKDKFLLEKKT